MKKTFAIILTILLLYAPCNGLAQEERPFAQVVSQEPAKDVSRTGKISLDIKGMDIVEVFKMLSSRYNMNIIVGKNVSGKVTLFLKDVDVWDAFEILILANDLAYEKKDDIINITTQRDYEVLYGERFQTKKRVKIVKLKYAKPQDISKVLTQMKTNIGKILVDDNSNTVVLIDTPESMANMNEYIKSADMPVQTKVFDLNYAQAEKLGTKLQDSMTKGIGSMKVDERTNKIAITDYPKKINEMTNIIEAFDEKPLQVLVDAQIIEVRPSDKFEMGVDWDYWLRKNYHLAALLPTAGAVSTLAIGVAAETLTKKPEKIGQYKAIIDILRTIGDAKILSSPRIMVLNNQEAKILVGTKDAYITSTTSQAGSGTAVTSQSVNFVDVGIKLYVTPTINRDGFVTMKIRPEISSATRTNITSAGQITQIPIVSTSETETTVLVKDGVTIIIAGLKKDEKSLSEKRIPFIGDIPILGLLFRNTSDEVKKTEIVILLTPHIVTGASPITDANNIKPKAGAIARMSKGNIITEEIVTAAENAENAAEGAEKERQAQIAKYYKTIKGNIVDLAPGYQTPGAAGQVTVFFTLSSDGQLKGEPKIVSSTNDKLEKAAIEVVKNASPFPPFPDALKGSEEENFQTTIEYI